MGNSVGDVDVLSVAEGASEVLNDGAAALDAADTQSSVSIVFHKLRWYVKMGE